MLGEPTAAKVRAAVEGIRKALADGEIRRDNPQTIKYLSEYLSTAPSNVRAAVDYLSELKEVEARQGLGVIPGIKAPTNLLEQHPPVVAFVSSETGTPYLKGVQSGFQYRAAKIARAQHGVRVPKTVALPWSSLLELETRLPGKLLGVFSGIVFLPTDDENLRIEVARLMAAANIPIVQVDGAALLGHRSVIIGTDRKKGGEDLARHVLRQAMLHARAEGQPVPDIFILADTRTDIEGDWAEGAKSVLLASRDVRFTPAVHMRLVSDQRVDWLSEKDQADFSLWVEPSSLRGQAAGRFLAKEILSEFGLVSRGASDGERRPAEKVVPVLRFALICLEAQVAAGVVEKLNAEGIQVPEQAIVACVDEGCGLESSFLTRSQPDAFEIGCAAASLIIGGRGSEEQVPASGFSAPRLQPRRSTESYLNHWWRTMPGSITIRRVVRKDKGFELPLMYANPAFEGLWGQPIGEIRHSLPEDLWGEEFAGFLVRCATHELEGKSLLTSEPLPFHGRKDDRFTFRFALPSAQGDGEQEYIASVSFRLRGWMEAATGAKPAGLLLPREPTLATKDLDEDPPAELIRALFEAFPASVAIRNRYNRLLHANARYRDLFSVGDPPFPRPAIHDVDRYYDKVGTPEDFFILREKMELNLLERIAERRAAQGKPIGVSASDLSALEIMRCILRYPLGDGNFRIVAYASLGVDESALRWMVRESPPGAPVAYCLSRSDGVFEDWLPLAL